MNSPTSNLPQEQLNSTCTGNENTSIEGGEQGSMNVHLPNEITHMICLFLDDESATVSLKNLRLVSRMFVGSATSHLFKNIQLGNKTPSVKNINDLRKYQPGPSRTILLPHSINVLKSDALCEYVREVTYSALIEEGNTEGKCLSPLERYNIYQEVISRLQRVTNISYNSRRAHYCHKWCVTDCSRIDQSPLIRESREGDSSCWTFIKAAISGLQDLRSLHTSGFLSWSWINPHQFTKSEKQCIRRLQELKIDIHPESAISVSHLLRYTSDLKSLAIRDFFEHRTFLYINLLLAKSKLPCLTSLTLLDIQVHEKDFRSFLLSVAPTLRSLNLQSMKIQGVKLQDEREYVRQCPWLSIFHFLGASMQLDDIYLEGYFSSVLREQSTWNIYKAALPNDPFSMYCRVEQYIINGSTFPLPAPYTDRSSIKGVEFSDKSFRATDSRPFY